jgi:hypothetical protein
VGQVEKTFDDWHGVMEGQFLLNGIFGPLIDGDNPNQDNQKDPIFFLHEQPKSLAPFLIPPLEKVGISICDPCRQANPKQISNYNIQTTKQDLRLQFFGFFHSAIGIPKFI